MGVLLVFGPNCGSPTSTERNPELQAEGSLSLDREATTLAEPVQTSEPSEPSQGNERSKEEDTLREREPTSSVEVTEAFDGGDAESGQGEPAPMEPVDAGGRDEASLDTYEPVEPVEPMDAGGGETTSSDADAPMETMEPVEPMDAGGMDTAAPQDAPEVQPEGGGSEVTESIPERGAPFASWARRAGALGIDYGLAIATDAQGNVLVTGAFGGKADFGNTTLTSKGGHDLFVAKLDSTGKWLWAKRAGSKSTDQGLGIAVGGQGNVLITGFFYGTADFGSTTLTSKGGADLFVAKLDSAGRWLWAKRAGAGSTHHDRGLGIAVGGQGSVLITGFFYGTADFGSTTLTSRGGADLFVAKLSGAGNWLWARRAGFWRFDQGVGVAVDSQDNVFITGTFEDAVNFGSTTLTSKGSSEILVAKLDSTGSWLWAKRAGASDFDIAGGVAVDSQDNVFISGTFRDTADFGSTMLTAKGNYEIFVAKLGGAGRWLWAKRAGSTNIDRGHGIAVDGQGNVLISGSFAGKADFGSTALTSKGRADIFAAKLGSAGGWLWAKGAGSTSSDESNGIAVDGQGNAFLIGTFWGTADFGSTTLTSKGQDEIFVLKLKP